MVTASQNTPTVSIGIPVFNGERYIREALACFLNQTYQDIEIIICDNASTDATHSICETYAHKYSNIRLYRNTVNRGAAYNYNLAFRKSQGKYFKWAAVDDLCDCTFVEKCVRILEKNPSVVLAYAKTTIIDEFGKALRPYDLEDHHLPSPSPFLRYRKWSRTQLECNSVFGLIRADALAQTRLIGRFIGSDNCLLAHLTLKGCFHEIPERLFLRRQHPQASTCNKAIDSQLQFFDPDLRGKIVLPYWRRYLENWRTIVKEKLPWREKRALYILQMKLLKWHRAYFMAELAYALRKVYRRYARGGITLKSARNSIDDKDAS